jgi:RHS repeat-associated protein
MGTVIWQAEPDDWGAVRNEDGVRQPIRFQGQWLDEESGFYYNRYRYYDPQQGRYVTQDPIGFSGGLNLYAYVGGNPLSYIDPLGLAGLVPTGPCPPAGWDHCRNACGKKSQIAQNCVAVNNGVFTSWGCLCVPKCDTPEVGPATDKAGNEVGRFVGDTKGNMMIEPKGGDTIPQGNNGVNTHTRYPNESNYQRLNPQGHGNNPTPHGHGHAPGTGPGIKGQGPSLDVNGNVVPSNSPAAHWPIK